MRARDCASAEILRRMRSTAGGTSASGKDRKVRLAAAIYPKAFSREDPHLALNLNRRAKASNGSLHRCCRLNADRRKIGPGGDASNSGSGLRTDVGKDPRIRGNGEPVPG